MSQYQKLTLSKVILLVQVTLVIEISKIEKLSIMDAENTNFALWRMF